MRQSTFDLLMFLLPLVFVVVMVTLGVTGHLH